MWTPSWSCCLATILSTDRRLLPRRRRPFPNPHKTPAPRLSSCPHRLLSTARSRQRKLRHRRPETGVLLSSVPSSSRRRRAPEVTAKEAMDSSRSIATGSRAGFASSASPSPMHQICFQVFHRLRLWCRACHPQLRHLHP